MHPGAVRAALGNNNDPLYRFHLHKILWRSLKSLVISGEAIYYLAAAPEMEAVSGKLFHRTYEKIPATHALDPELGKKMFAISKQLIGIIFATRPMKYQSPSLGIQRWIRREKQD
jgi:hypothetical protein